MNRWSRHLLLIQQTRWHLGRRDMTCITNVFNTQPRNASPHHEKWSTSQRSSDSDQYILSYCSNNSEKKHEFFFIIQYLYSDLSIMSLAGGIPDSVLAIGFFSRLIKTWGRSSSQDYPGRWEPRIHPIQITLSIIVNEKITRSLLKFSLGHVQ